MNRYTTSLGIVALLLGTAMAHERLPMNAKPLSAILEAAEQAKITDITEVSFDDGVWEIEGFQNGQALEFHFNPVTGALLSSHSDTNHRLIGDGILSALAVARQLEKGGFQTITELEWEGTFWSADVTFEGQPRELQIDPRTGVILSNRVDH